MATFTSTIRSTFTTVTASVDLVGSLAQTAANHTKVWEAESAAKLEQRLKDVAVTAKAQSSTYRQEQALKLMLARRSIESQLKSEADRKLYEACLSELSE